MYNIQVFKLKKRRKLISGILSIIILIAGWNIVSESYNAIRDGYLINCLGQEVCIYRGPKDPFPNYYAYTKVLNNGDIFITKSAYNNFYHKLVRIPRKIPFINGHYNLDIQYSEQFPGYKDTQHYLYKIKKYKFIKIKALHSDTKVGCDIPTIISDGKNNFYEACYNQKNIEYFNHKKNKFEITTKNPFNTKQVRELKPIMYIGQYAPNQALFMTNHNRIHQNIIKYGFTLEHPLLKPERLYFMDMTNFKMTPLPKFAQNPKYYPNPDDFKFLSNGKIIILIRGCSHKVWRNNYQQEFDHIEIYDPSTNTFQAEYNSEVLNNNLFNFELDNGNILFINKKSSWIFNNKTNKFEKTNDADRLKYLAIVNQNEKELKKNVGIELEEESLDITRFIKLTPNTYLMTCGIRNFLPPICRSEKCSPMCNNTIYYNFKTNKVKKGPKFLYTPAYAHIHKIKDNKFIIISEGTPDGAAYINEYNRQILPYEYIQFLKINKSF